MTETDTQPWLTLEREALLLFASMPLVLLLVVWLSYSVHQYAGAIPFLVWFVWFTTWASKGGIPPRY